MTAFDELLPYLPMVYVAWADGTLSAEELEQCRQQLDDAALSPQASKQLFAWLDPEAPPGAEELRDILDKIRHHANSANCDTRQGLAELGAQLATAHGAAPDPSTRASLSALERTLGVAPGEACRELLQTSRPPAPTMDTVPSDSVAMRQSLDGTFSQQRDKVRSFLETRSPHLGAALSIDDQRAAVRNDLLQLAQTGFAADAYAANPQSFFAAMETLAMGDLSLWVKSGVQFGLFGGAIHALGNERHHELLPQIADGSLLGCFAMTEWGHGSNVMEIETTLTYVHESRELEITTPSEAARKEYIGGAACDATLAVVFGQLLVGGRNHGVHAVLVPLRDGGDHLPGVKTADGGAKMGLNGVDNGSIWFDRVRVRVENLLNRFGGISEEGRYHSPIPAPNKRFFSMLGTLVSGRVAVAGAAVSAAKVGLTSAIRYGNQRRQFGPPGTPEMRVLDYTSHQVRLMPRLASVWALHYAVAEAQDRAAHLREQSALEARSTETFVAAIKAAASWEAIDILSECRQACGGRGYMAQTRLPALIKDTHVFATFEGDNTVLMQLVAKTLLSEFRDELQEARVWGLVRHIARQARTAVVEKNPMAVRRTDDDHILDHDFHHQALRYREQQLLTTLGQRLKRRIENGMDTFLAFAEVSDHATVLGRAFAERSIHEAFAKAATSEAFTGTPAPDMCRLYGLSRIMEARGWFVENEYLAPDKARAIRRQVVRLSRKVAGNAVALVDGFGVPPSCLGQL